MGTGRLDLDLKIIRYLIGSEELDTSRLVNIEIEELYEEPLMTFILGICVKVKDFGLIYEYPESHEYYRRVEGFNALRNLLVHIKDYSQDSRKVERSLNKDLLSLLKNIQNRIELDSETKKEVPDVLRMNSLGIKPDI